MIGLNPQACLTVLIMNALRCCCRLLRRAVSQYHAARNSPVSGPRPCSRWTCAPVQRRRAGLPSIQDRSERSAWQSCSWPWPLQESLYMYCTIQYGGEALNGDVGEACQPQRAANANGGIGGGPEGATTLVACLFR